MDDFYKKIKEHKSNETDHGVPDNAWDNFQDFTEEKDSAVNAKPFAFWPWVSGILATLLFASIFFFTSKLNHDDYSNDLAIIHDTIYIEKWKENKSGNTDSEDENTIADLKLNISNYQEALTSKNKQLLYSKNRINEITNEYKNLLRQFEIKQSRLKNLETTVAQRSTTIIDKKNSKLTNGKEFKNEIHSFIESKNSLLELYTETRIINPFYTSSPIKSIRRRPLLDNLSPKTFSLGLDLGIIHPTDYYNTNTAIGVLAGIVLNTYFTPRWRGQFEFTNINFFVEDKDPLSNPNIPALSPPENTNLKSVSITNNSLQSTIGLEYILRKGNIWRPFIGLSYGVEINRYPTFNFEYDTAIGEIYQKIEQYRNPIYTSIYRINGGVDYHINKSLDLQAHLSFQQNQNSTNLTSLKTRLLYHF